MHLGICFINYCKKNTEKILKNDTFKDINIYVGDGKTPEPLLGFSGIP